MGTRGVRGGLVSLFVCLVLCLGTVMPVSAQLMNGTPGAPEDEPTATTAPPEEPTEIPATEAPATEPPVATDVPATEIPPTATDEPTEEPELEAAAPVWGILVQFDICGNSDRVGETDVFFSGAIGAAANSPDCVQSDQVEGAALSVTLVNVDDPSLTYVESFSDGLAYFGTEEVEAGDYTVTVSNGAGYTASAGGPVTFIADGEHELHFILYEEADAIEDPGEAGTGAVQGTFVQCLDPERAGTLDLFIRDFAGAADASQCANPEYGSARLTLAGTTVDNTPYTTTIVVESGGSAEFIDVPYGTYTLTDVASGAASEPFPVGGSNGGAVFFTAIVYYADEPALLGSVQASKFVCGVPADDTRVGTTEFALMRDGSLGASASCEAVPESDAFPVDVTLTGPDAYAETGTLEYQTQAYEFYALHPGDYTLSEETATGYSASSDPFAVGAGEFVFVQIVNYVTEDSDTPTFDPEGSFLLAGSIAFCTSSERDGEVDFFIYNFQAAGTSECTSANGDAGPVTLLGYGSDAEPSAEPLTSTQLYTGPNGEFGTYSQAPTQGWYQLVYQPSSFGDQEYRSKIFAVESSYVQAQILAYVATEELANVLIFKHFCNDPAREGEADFFVSAIPEGSLSGEVPVSGAATTACSFFVDETPWESLTFTLTDVETGESVDATGSFIPLPVIFYTLPGVPAGTYTLTETFDDGEGDVLVVTSDPFTVGADPGDVMVDVYNYGDMPIDEPVEGVESAFVLRAFTCIDDALAGEIDFFTSGNNIFSPLSGASDIAAAATTTNECVAATDAYEFTLSTDAEFSAQADYPLTPLADGFYVYSAGNPAYGQDPIPSGTYTLREATTGFVSEPFAIHPGTFNMGEFYVYAAAPTPTATVEPSATATVEPSATATLEPGVTPTVDPAAPTRISQNPPGGGSGDGDADGDGIPDETDPDDDNDGVPDAEDPDTGSGDVTTLPSTGQGTAGSGSMLMVAVLLGGAVLLAGAALRAGTRRR
jgi:hypothetical protein